MTPPVAAPERVRTAQMLPTSHPAYPPVYRDGALNFDRRWTKAGENPLDDFTYTYHDVIISDLGGAVAFEMTGVEVPDFWDALSAKILASKYLRKTGIPQRDADGEIVRDAEGNVVTGPETSAKQAVSRLANAFMFYGQRNGYFASEDDAVAYRDELAHMIMRQAGASNSPVWFNVGLWEAYEIVEDPEGNSYFDANLGQVVPSPHKYQRASVNACFIQSVEDQLVGDMSIFDLMEREARLFKGGSGSGSNFSKIRAKGEGLTGGGRSSGMMSFLRVIDQAAGSIKSGGTTRRAAKMVIVDGDHPEIEEFIWCKANEEKKIPHLEAAGYSTAWNDPNGAYAQVFFQNANHSVRISRGFMDTVRRGGDWDLKARRDGEVIKTIPARKLWEDIAQAAWQCADPGIQFDDIINDWATAPNDGPIRGTNPCSEYIHNDDTACNLASMNLVKFWDQEAQKFDVDGFRFATRVWTTTLELAVVMSHYPSPAVAKNSYEHRTLGLGYCNVGALLMRAGLPYDSDAGRAVMGAITSVMHSSAYATSAEMASVAGPCIAYQRNVEPMHKVLRNHRRAAYGSRAREASLGAYEGLDVAPQEIDHRVLRETTFAELSDIVLQTADEMVESVARNGARNMQATVLAPTGTIGLLMGADTTGVEPAFSLVAFKTLAGGGSVKIVNNSVRPALEALGYDAAQQRDIVKHIIGTGTLMGETPVNLQSLQAKGVPNAVLETIESQLASSMDLAGAFHPFVLDQSDAGRDFAAKLEISDDAFTFLDRLGFTPEEILVSSLVICGHQNVERAPHMRPSDVAVFDTANEGGTGTRSIHWSGHVKALGATAPFLSGAASKTINMPNSALLDDVRDAHELSYQQGVKCVAIYRDGSKLSQPLSSKTKEAEAEAEIADDGIMDLSDDTIRELLAAAGNVPDGMSPTQFYANRRPSKFRLPSVRSSVTEKFSIGGQDVFLTHGQYADGSLGEIFLKLSKEGGTLEGLCAAFATSISMGLQRGVPLEEYVSKFRMHKFEPAGVVSGHPNLKMAQSILDAVFRILSYRYLNDEHAVQNPADPLQRPPMGWQTSFPMDTDAAPAVPQPSALDEAAAQREVDLAKLTEAAEEYANRRPDAAGGTDFGFSTETCSDCGGRMYPNGACHICRDCGATSGCS